MLKSEPVFRNGRDAVTFALNYSGEQYARSTLALLAQDGAIGSGRGLSGFDGAATVALVKSKMERLSRCGQATLIARCASRNSSGWLAAIEELGAALIESSNVHANLVSLYVRRHFGERMTMQQIADRIGVTRVTVHRQIAPAKEKIDRIEAESWAQFEDALRCSQLIEDY